ncbi:MAG: double-strand break repair nuclease NurA [Methanothermococcus sp.]|nr:double-strand break repair nuclease NurA [Methanothermococcus sp.]MDK2987290.1 double-strand break repair nuclease NurA [Methanothermococcus sp.]
MVVLYVNTLNWGAHMDFSYLMGKKDTISKKISNINMDFDYENYWIPCNFNNPSSCVFAGGDGSFNKIDYIGYCLYIVGTVSYIHEPGKKIKESLSHWDADIILPYKYVSDRLRLYMLNMELKTALWNLKNNDIDYYLFDGSLYSLLIQTHTYGSITEGKKVEDGIFKYYKDYGKEIKNKILEDLDNSMILPTIDYGETDDQKIIILEQLEYLILLMELLKNYREKIVGISKTSKMNAYFKKEKSLVPDIAIFSKNCRGIGYTKPLNLADDEVNSNSYSSVKYLNTFGQTIDSLYYQFARLEDNSGVIGITSFDKLNEEFFSSLREISISGYPYILKKSHEGVKISEESIKKYAKLVGIYEKTDRETNLNV